MNDEQKYHLWLTDPDVDETMSDGRTVEMGRWYHIGADEIGIRMIGLIVAILGLATAGLVYMAVVLVKKAWEG